MGVGHIECGAARPTKRSGVPLPDLIALECPNCGDDERYVRGGRPGPFVGASYGYYD